MQVHHMITGMPRIRWGPFSGDSHCRTKAARNGNRHTAHHSALRPAGML